MKHSILNPRRGVVWWYLNRRKRWSRSSLVALTSLDLLLTTTHASGWALQLGWVQDIEVMV